MSRESAISSVTRFAQAGRLREDLGAEPSASIGSSTASSTASASTRIAPTGVLSSWLRSPRSHRRVAVQPHGLRRVARLHQRVATPSGRTLASTDWCGRPRWRTARGQPTSARRSAGPLAGRHRPGVRLAVAHHAELLARPVVQHHTVGPVEHDQSRVGRAERALQEVRHRWPGRRHRELRSRRDRPPPPVAAPSSPTSTPSPKTAARSARLPWRSRPHGKRHNPVHHHSAAPAVICPTPLRQTFPAPFIAGSPVRKPATRSGESASLRATAAAPWPRPRGRDRPRRAPSAAAHSSSS